MQSLFKKSAILSVMLTSMWTGQAQATPITWTFNNATLKDTQTLTGFGGGTITNIYNYVVSGSFTYDADTKQSSNANISYTYSSPFGANNQPNSGGIVIKYDTLNNQTSISFTEAPAFRFNGLLTNAGGTKSFINYNQYGYSSIVSTGTLTASASSVSAVPVPAAAWLFGSGLLGLMGFANRRKV